MPRARKQVELFPIRTVANVTGVNAITLRAWERRYGLVTPVRTDGGQRLYTREEIELIQRIVVLLTRKARHQQPGTGGRATAVMNARAQLVAHVSREKMFFGDTPLARLPATAKLMQEWHQQLFSYQPDRMRGQRSVIDRLDFVLVEAPDRARELLEVSGP